VIFLYSRGLPQESWTTYFHFSIGDLTGQNWLWFLPVLFLFNVSYFLLARLNISLRNMSFKMAILVALLLGFVYSISMDIFGLRGWTKTLLIDFQNERLLIYFLVFLLGALAFRRNIFGEKPQSKKLYIGAILTLSVSTFLVSNLIISLYRRAVDLIRKGIRQPEVVPRSR
jgi:hypothetical protein